MSKKEQPKFIQNIPHGIDKFEGGSADRVADAIKNHIDSHKASDKIPKIIGIDGQWGSGKSNVIRILNNKLGDGFYLFEYDAWGHQEDLQRRSFIETLTSELVAKEILTGTTSIKIKNGELRNVTWEQKLTYLLSRKLETETKSYPKIGYGIIVAFFTAISLPFFYYIASVNTIKSYWSSLVVAAPILISLIIWLIACIRNEKYRNIDYLLAIYDDKVREDITFETISEDEPSVADFRKWMQDVSTTIDGKGKLIIVFDNMDRLPPDKVKELWSSIHTFFADSNGYPNIWVIIPFDKKHLANNFSLDSKDEAKNYEIISHFINKTFPVIYRVAPPVMTAWKKIFNIFYNEAFGNSENEDKETIQRIFGVIRQDFTPRDIIAFINELVSLKRTWNEEISLLHIAIFVLKKDEILKSPVESILSGQYLKQIEKIVQNSEELQENISSLTYGVDSGIAKQIPLRKYLLQTLNDGTKEDINKYAEHLHFVEILEEIIRDLDIALLDNAITCLSKLDKKINITKQWNELVRLNISQQIIKLSFEETHKILLINSDDTHKKRLTKYLCENFREYKDFKGNFFYTAMQELKNCIKENNLNVSITNYIQNKVVSAEIIVEYLNEAKEEYKEFKLLCNNNELNQHLIKWSVDVISNFDFIEFLIKDESYSFKDFESRIVKLITDNEMDFSYFNRIIKVYTLISEEKPLKQQFTKEQIKSFYEQIRDKNSEAYYHLVAMELSNQLINTEWTEGLDEKVAERLEYYKEYGDLLILSKDWDSELLRKSVKIMTEKSYGEVANILDIIPFFQEISTALNISADSFLNELSNWEESIKEITTENIESLIPQYSFYEYSSNLNNKLTAHINKTAITRLENITVDELYGQQNTPSYYWFNCASILIKGNILKSIPENLIDFCKRILIDIAAGTQSIPTLGSALDTIINNVKKDKLQPTIKTICDDFCNKTKTISPELFAYFVVHFDFINKMDFRDEAITRNILNVVITDANCLALILENRDGYVKKINTAGNDAEDLKANIRQLRLKDKTEKLQEFAIAIGINEDDEIEEGDEKNEE